jgi:hypothetical protein
MRAMLFILPAIVHLTIPANLAAQQNSGNTPGEEPAQQSALDQAILRWEIFLGSVAQDAKTAFPEERRVYPTVEAANAYWETDRDISTSLYVKAIDNAISMTRQDKKNRSLISYVISSSAKLDGELTKALNERLADAELKLPDDFRLDSAMDLIESDPESAARLAEAMAPAGAENGSAMRVIYQLAEKDKRLSDRVYDVYLQRIAADPRIGLGAVDYFAGYAFGYSEYCAVLRDGASMYSILMPNRALAAQRFFTRSFLQTAYNKTSGAIDQRNRAVGDDLKNLNFQIAFTFQYLVPEVALLSPNDLPVWQQLQQQGFAGITAPELERAGQLVQSIHQMRAQNQTASESPQASEQEIVDGLDDIEKITGTCQRDAAYGKAAMRLAILENFTKAFEVADKIETPKQEADVIEYIRIQMAENAIENSEPNAEKQFEKISRPEILALLYAELAIKTKDRSKIDEAVRVGEKLENAENRTGLLFGLSSLLINIDPAAAQPVFRKAVKNLDQTEPTDKPTFLMNMSVLVGCDGERSYFGWGKSIPNSTVFEAISEFAKRDPDTASSLANEIGDKITKLRAQAMIAKIALADLEKRKKAEQAKVK